MAISYPVDVANTKWTVYQVSTSSVIARNKTWPVADGSAIPGLDPDFVYLLQSEDAKPDVDARLYYLEASDTPDIPNNTITRAWVAKKRAEEERKTAAENREIEELGKWIDIERELIETRLAVAAILQYIDGLQTPTKVQTFLDNYQSRGVSLWKNRDRLKAIIAEIEANQDPDLDAGWEPTA